MLAHLLAGRAQLPAQLLHLLPLRRNGLCQVIAAVRPPYLTAFQVLTTMLEDDGLQFSLLVGGLHPYPSHCIAAVSSSVLVAWGRCRLSASCT